MSTRKLPLAIRVENNQISFDGSPCFLDDDSINPSVSITGGDSYHYRQYFIMDRYENMQTQGGSWSSEAVDGEYAAGSRTGRTVSLFSDGTGSFDYTLSGEACASSQTLVCNGSTTPQTNAKALFQVVCGTNSAVTDDPYYFTPTDTSSGYVRSYVCDGQPGVRPTWTLLGFFAAGACADIAVGYTMDSTLC